MKWMILTLTVQYFIIGIFFVYKGTSMGTLLFWFGIGIANLGMFLLEK